MIPLQLSSFLEVIPAWLPPVTISGGFIILLTGVGKEYFKRIFNHWRMLSPQFIGISVVCFSLSTAAAAYITIQQHELTLLFVFFTFMSGRVIQGAIAARIIQKVLDFFFSESSSSKSLLVKSYEYIKSKIRERAILLFSTGIITVYTILSIVAVYTIGNGETIEAIERFWVGFFFLTITGLVFDFRHFAHRISWTAAIGLVIATTGAFLYSPAGFSSFTVALAPYLENPVPDWMRLPLGAAGSLFGVMLWAIFYTKE
jgi:hypothetical protein